MAWRESIGGGVLIRSPMAKKVAHSLQCVVTAAVQAQACLAAIMTMKLSDNVFDML